MAKDFIKGAISHPGALTAAAKAAGQSNEEWARAHKNDSGVSGDRARFFFTLQKVRPKSAKKG